MLGIAAGVGGGWYLATKGFGRKTRELITEELHKRGVEAHIAHLTLDPFRGLIAQDVRIYDYKNRENTLAVVSEIALDLNYAALLQRQPFLNGLDVRNAQLRLPVPAKSAKEKPQLQHFNAHIYFPPEQIVVSQAEGLFCGVRISVTGQLIKRADYKPSPPLTPEEWERRLSILQRLVDELEKLKYPAEHPSLQVKFSGDLADLEDARVEATLRGAHVRRGEYELHDLLATTEYAEQRLTINQLEWHDAGGIFSAHGDWSRQTGVINLHARSSIDVQALLASLGQGKLLTDAIFASPPKIDISASGKIGEQRPEFKITGHAAVDGLTYHNVPLTDVAADFAWDGERTFVRELRARQDKGELRADLLDAPNDFRLNVDSTIDPMVVKSALSPEMQKFLREWQFQERPAIHLEIRGPNDKPESWQGDGTLALGRTRFRGAWMNSATSKIHFGDGAVTYSDLRVVRDDGSGSGTFTYDFKNHEVRINNIKTSMNPVEAIVWVDPDLVKTILPYKFHQPPNLSINGLYQFAGGKGTKIDIVVDGARGLDYVFLGQTLPFDRVTAKLIFTNDRLQIVDLRGAIFSGSVRGGAEISLAHNDQRYHAKIAAEHLDFPKLTDLYWQYKTAHGLLNGAYDFTGVGADARAMRGTGKIEVTNGDVFAIPVFGPLSGIMSSILPGTGYSIGKKATASFKIDNGVIHTDDLEVAGEWFSMLGHGDLHFLDDKLNFEVRMDMHGAAGLLMKPVYKFFEYVGEGSLKKPDWHPKRF
ncbi:MAG: hypothetical protein QOG48_351 [Verrucomicrobiota bacterium]